MGARPAEFEPTNLETPSLGAAGRKGSLVTDCVGFEFFVMYKGVMCTEQATALWLEKKHILWWAMEMC